MCIYTTIDLLLQRSSSHAEALKLLHKLWVANYNYLTDTEKTILTRFIMKIRDILKDA